MGLSKKEKKKEKAAKMVESLHGAGHSFADSFRKAQKRSVIYSSIYLLSWDGVYLSRI